MGNAIVRQESDASDHPPMPIPPRKHSTVSQARLLLCGPPPVEYLTEEQKIFIRTSWKIIEADIARVGVITFVHMEIPMISKKTYESAEQRIGDSITKSVHDQCKVNGEVERKLAIESGHVVTVGDAEIPYINVTVDGGWAKRSFGHSYNSNAGVGVIIGSRTQKILFLDHRVKCCVICDKYSIKDTDAVPDHVCYKNWSNSSQSMEADVIVAGFQRSMQDHGLMYRYLVGDADSSVFSRVQAEVIYPGRIPVEKVDCINHALRGLNAVIHKVLNNSAYNLQDRKLIEAQMNRFGKDVRAAVSYNHSHQSDPDVKTTATSLYQDIVNIPAHIFGCHDSCKPYFCTKDHEVVNSFNKIKLTTAGKEILTAFNRLANRSQRLIYNTTSNYAECFMSVMSKCISGKRINYAQRGGYARRVMSAALSYNGSAFWLPYVFPPRIGFKTSEVWIKAAEYFLKSKGRGPTLSKQGPFKSVPKKRVSNPDQEYGPDSFQGLLSDVELEVAIRGLVESLQVSTEQQKNIQESTIGQSFNTSWKYERRNRLTASNSGRVFKLKDFTSSNSILKSIIFPPDLSKIEHIRNGINLEPEAKRVYTQVTGLEVKECGIFIYRKNGVLAASPDGLIEDSGILEIKCTTCKPDDVPDRADKFLKRTEHGNLSINTSHKYYHQIITQLYVSEKQFCDFFIYHRPNTNQDQNIYFHCERISRNEQTDTLWSEMETKLIRFFTEDMAPELVDPQYQQTGLFRIPAYRQDAISLKSREKLEKDATRRLKKDAILQKMGLENSPFLCKQDSTLRVDHSMKSIKQLKSAAVDQNQWIFELDPVAAGIQTLDISVESSNTPCRISEPYIYSELLSSINAEEHT